MLFILVLCCWWFLIVEFDVISFMVNWSTYYCGFINFFNFFSLYFLFINFGWISIKKKFTNNVKDKEIERNRSWSYLGHNPKPACDIHKKPEPKQKSRNFFYVFLFPCQNVWCIHFDDIIKLLVVCAFKSKLENILYFLFFCRSFKLILLFLSKISSVCGNYKFVVTFSHICACCEGENWQGPFFVCLHCIKDLSFSNI